MCRFVVELYRTGLNNYMPGELSGRRLECMCLGMCVGIGDFEGKPFTAAKLAVYMDMPRATVIRRLAQLQKAGVVVRNGRHYCLKDATFNGVIGMRNYNHLRSMFTKTAAELSVLDETGQ